MNVPSAVTEITDDWLTEMLHGNGRLPAASSVSVEGIGPAGGAEGWMCEVARLELVFDGDPGDLPSQMIAKLPVDDENVKAMLAEARLYEREGSFYRDMASRLGSLVPTCHLVIVDPATEEHLLLIEDLGDARPGDQLSSCTLEEAEHVMGALARFHAPWWGSPELETRAWLPTIDEAGGMGADLYRGSIDTFRHNFGHLLDPANEAITTDIPESAASLLGRLARAPQTLTHFDYRLDNMFFDAPGEPVRLIDFQTVCRGRPGYDLGYFLSQSLDTEIRRGHERALIEVYVSELAARGIDDYTPDDAWDDYRVGALYAWITPVFVTASLDVSDERATDMWSAVVARSQAAQSDLELAELLDI